MNLNQLSLFPIVLLLINRASSFDQFNSYRDVCGSLCTCDNQILNCTCWWGTRTNFVLTADIRARNFHTVLVQHCGKVELDLVNPTYGLMSDLIFQSIRRLIFRNLTELSIYPYSLESTSLEELSINDVSSLIADNASIVNNGSKPHHVQRVILRNVTSASVSSYFLNVTSLEALILDACHFDVVEPFAFYVGRLTSLLITNSVVGEMLWRAIDVDSHVSDVTIKKSQLGISTALSFSFKSVTRMIVKDNRFEEIWTGFITAPLDVSSLRFTGNRANYVEENPFWPMGVTDSLDFSRNVFGSVKANLLPSFESPPVIVTVESNSFSTCDRQEAIHLRHLSEYLANSSFCLFEDGVTIPMAEFFAEDVPPQIVETSTKVMAILEDVTFVVTAPTSSNAKRDCSIVFLILAIPILLKPS